MANKSYRVLSGSFRKPNDELVEVGGTIELPVDVAARFRNQLSETFPVESTKKAGTAKAEGDD
ncbi:hypothetical protein [Pseudomonas putida]|uniref:hypothetical protein n=1 Tax=Pseudomonas putida TaxID=303 RepID=UPI002363C128|nr:hypothetical protein [Pseudomonas putida]MDD2098924.1 hypothetical protein [Pseudomonas putida]